MGTDLALGFSPHHQYAGTSPAFPFVLFDTTNRLVCDRQYGFFTAICALQPQPLPGHWMVVWYDNTGATTVATDPAFLRPLTYLEAGRFALLDPAGLTLSPWNRAILVFLQALPPESPLVLWWH